MKREDEREDSGSFHQENDGDSETPKRASMAPIENGIPSVLKYEGEPEIDDRDTDQSAASQIFIKAIARHRHWEREPAV